MDTISPQVTCLVREMASKILRRVWSASALDIFSTSERFMGLLKCSRVTASTARKKPSFAP